MKRIRSRVVGLLDLPEGVLHLILSFLGTLSLAAARLSCRALREAATSGRKRIFINEGDNMATVCASLRVLQTIHTFQILLDRLEAERLGVCAQCLREPDRSPSQQFRRFLVKQLIMNLAPEIESFSVERGWFSLDVDTGEVPPEPHFLLPRMQRLESLRLVGPFNSAILPELPALGRLTCLEVDNTCSNQDIQKICSTLSLSRFAVYRSVEEEVDLDVQQMLAALAAGSTAGLRKLVLPLPAAEARHLNRLNSLTALTALELLMKGTFADLGGLAILTGLKSLDMEILPGFGETQPVVKSLSPLTALTGLTLLGVWASKWDGNVECNLPSDVSVLSSLVALRVLQCSYFGPAEIFPGDPLPVQFRFLRSATALVMLELGFRRCFWSLPHASSLAMREAVCALTSLRRVRIVIEGSGLEQKYAPLSVFAAAGSIESFTFCEYGRNSGSLVGHSSAQALACFKALAKLRSLSLHAFPGAGNIPRCADLLAGLPSTCLTRVDLHVKPEPLSLELMQQIARFPDLQCLRLESSDVDPRFFAQLPELKCLTCLSLEVEPAPEHVAAISAQAAQLKTVILERTRQVGVKAHVAFMVWRSGHGTMDI